LFMPFDFETTIGYNIKVDIQHLQIMKK